MQSSKENVAAVTAAVDMLAGMDKFPKWEEGARAALIAEFVESYPTPEAASDAARGFLQWVACPTVREVREAARVTNNRARLMALQPLPDCPLCDNTGFVPIEIPHTENVYEFCVCEFGKLLKGPHYGRANRMSQAAARGVRCEKCSDTGEVLRKIDVPRSAVKPCTCPRGMARKGAAA